MLIYDVLKITDSNKIQYLFTIMCALTIFVVVPIENDKPITLAIAFLNFGFLDDGNIFKVVTTIMCNSLNVA